MVATGNVVREFNIWQTRIRICDDYCKDRTKDDINEILRRIAKNALGPLSSAPRKNV